MRKTPRHVRNGHSGANGIKPKAGHPSGGSTNHRGKVSADKNSQSPTSGSSSKNVADNSSNQGTGAGHSGGGAGGAADATKRELPSGYTRNSDGTINGPGNVRGQRALFRETGQVDASGNPILQRDSGGYFRIDAAGKQQRIAAGDLPPALRNRGGKPWQQSQSHIQQQVGAREKSYLNGIEVPPGTPGSVRPDAVLNCGTRCYEVKNYNLSSTSGQNSLVRTTVEQINQRTIHLPKGMQQKIRIDITGQNVSRATQTRIRANIVAQSNGAVAPSDIKFFVRDPQ